MEKARGNTEVKNCVICDDSFEPKGRRHITCSPECSMENRRRKIVERTGVGEGRDTFCAKCGKPFHSRFGAKYCDDDCRAAMGRTYRRRSQQGVPGVFEFTHELDGKRYRLYASGTKKVLINGEWVTCENTFRMEAATTR